MLIASDDELREYLPNALITVEGETSLFDKIKHYLLKAELWLIENFTGEDVLTAIEQLAPDSVLRQLATKIVVLDAFYRAVPQLDLVLTPNGFGIVSNQNIAPASPDRVKRLLDSLIMSRDDLASDLVLILARRSDWPTTEQGKYFAATLWPSLELSPLAGYTTGKWEHFKQLRLQVLTIEQELAERFVSVELLARLHQHQFLQTVSAEERMVIDSLRQTTLEVLAGKQFDQRRMIALVEHIRTKPDIFPEWQGSSTSLLFSGKSFENRKHAAGYWW